MRWECDIEESQTYFAYTGEQTFWMDVLCSDHHACSLPQRFDLLFHHFVSSRVQLCFGGKWCQTRNFLPQWADTPLQSVDQVSSFQNQNRLCWHYQLLSQPGWKLAEVTEIRAVFTLSLNISKEWIPRLQEDIINRLLSAAIQSIITISRDSKF